MATEKQLFKLVGDILVAGFATPQSPQTSPAVQVTQAAQPTQQGIPTTATIFMTKLPDYRYGSRGMKDEWIPDTVEGGGVQRHTETQIYESTFQLNALAPQDPRITDQATAADIVNFAAYIMQSDATIRTLRENGVGIERVTQVRNTPFQDDRDQWEYSSSFDFVLTHKQIVTTEIDVLQSTELAIYQI